MNTKAIQELLRSYEIDAWLLYDFRGSNSIAWKILGLPEDTHCTRRWAVIIPAEGEALKIVNGIERQTLAHVEAKEVVYSSRIDWQNAVADSLKPYKKIALEYSPNGDLPTVSKVDAGMMDFLRSLGSELVSSADVAQHFDAVWSEEQFRENLTTAHTLRKIMMDAFTYIRELMRQERFITEHDVQKHILEMFEKNNLCSDSKPIVAIGKNAANPHYAPSEDTTSPIVTGDVILIDMWAKPKTEGSVYSDISWVGYVGGEVPERVAQLFSLIRDARDAASALVRERYAAGQAVHGFEVDDAARKVINDAGYGQYFIHRTGHNITEETHGPGANMDNFETHDTRRILPGTSFSIEPGIYIPDDIGLRTEIDIVVTPQGEILIPSEPVQKEVIALLGDAEFTHVEAKDEAIS